MLMNSQSPSGGASPVAPTEPQNHEVERCDRKRILVVEDEAAIRSLFQTILSFGLPDREIEPVANGAEALAAFGRGHHAVLLMDLHMPVMDGQVAFTEIERLCRDRNWEMPAVVFCTGFAPPQTLLNVVGGGGRHTLMIKPVSSAALVHAIRSRLQ